MKWVLAYRFIYCNLFGVFVISTLQYVISELDIDYASLMAVMLTCTIYAQSESRPEYRLP
jgi:Ca2+-dependent lipid-binding protein